MAKNPNNNPYKNSTYFTHLHLTLALESRDVQEQTLVCEPDDDLLPTGRKFRCGYQHLC